MKFTFVNSANFTRSRFLTFGALALGVVLGFAGNAAADVVSYFNFDSGNYVNSQLTPTVSGNPTTITGRYGEGMDFAAGDRWVFTGDQLVDFLSSLDKTCTISFWACAKSDTRSTGGTRNAFWLSNDATFNDSSSNNRNMFCHFAYSNGNAYFDSGNSGYDRINKAYNAANDYPEGESGPTYERGKIFVKVGGVHGANFPLLQGRWGGKGVPQFYCEISGPAAREGSPWLNSFFDPLHAGTKRPLAVVLRGFPRSSLCGFAVCPR